MMEKINYWGCDDDPVIPLKAAAFGRAALFFWKAWTQSGELESLTDTILE